MSRHRSAEPLAGLLLLALLAIPLSPARAGLVPGRMPEDWRRPIRLPETQSQGLAAHYTTTGHLALSVDGLGTMNASGWVQVRKPAGATVRRAFLAAATTGFTGATIPDGTMGILGTPVTFTQVVTNTIGSRNLADVTTLVKPTLDAAPAGLLDISVTEGTLTAKIDGSILAVVFDDPGQAADRTVTLFFGALDVNGDAFHIALAEPAHPGDPATVLDLALGISYGFQDPSTTNQVSRIDVNGARLTSCAGGQDDGQSSDGALLTVGGVGDAQNPADPLAPPANFNSDDELYDLRPFVKEGDRQVEVTTINPSLDDNIFFGALFMSGTALVNEGIALSPNSASALVGQSLGVTALVQAEDGTRVANRLVTFHVTAGPDAGLVGSGLTDAQGEATFQFTGSSAGTDVVEATFVNNAGATVTANPVTRTWVLAEACVQCPPDVTAPVPSGQSYDITFPFCNCGPAADQFHWCITDALGWAPAACDSTPLAPGSCASPKVTGTVPMKLSAAADTNVFTCVTWTGANPTQRDTCSVRLPIRPPIVPVVLARFSAESAADGVHLAWEAAAEVNHAGYLVWRAVEGDAAGFTRLTPTLVTGSGPHEFVDHGAPAGCACTYRLAAVDRAGNTTVAGERRVVVRDAPPTALLDAARPNPFRDGTTLRVSPVAPGRLTARVFDATGRLVRTLFEGAADATPFALAWDGRDDVGRRTPAGLYLVRVESAGTRATTRVLRIN